MTDYTEISKDKLHSALQENFTKLLEKVEDPTAEEKRKYIYQRQPDTAALDKGDFPYIVLENYSISDESATVNGNIVSFSGTVEIHVEAKDDAGIKQKQYHDRMCDGIIQLALGQELYDLGRAKIAIPTANGNGITRNTRSTAVTEDGMPIVRREIEIDFRCQIEMGG